VGAHGEGPIDFRFIQRNSPPELKPVEGEDAIGNAPVANASAQGYCGEARVCLNAVKMGHRPSMIAAFLRRSPSAISKIFARSLCGRFCDGGTTWLS
jgi:hypothetical protein